MLPVTLCCSEVCRKSIPLSNKYACEAFFVHLQRSLLCRWASATEARRARSLCNVCPVMTGGLTVLGLSILSSTTIMTGLPRLSAELQEMVLTYVSIDFGTQSLVQFRVLYTSYHRTRILGETVVTKLEVKVIKHHDFPSELLDC